MSERFTGLVGCRLPLQLAGMGVIGTLELAVAVAQAGGLGMVPVDAVRADGGPLREARRTTPALGVNVLMPFLERDVVERVAPDARLVEYFYAEPDTALVELVHDAGALVSWQVGSTDEARRAVDAGCDLVVAQGVEAGGHVRGTTPLRALLDDVLAAVEVPVVAAGGITTRADVERVLGAGADAVRIGTRFVVARESIAHPDYVAALCAAGDDATELTTTFNQFWDAPHRVLRSAVAAVRASTDSDPEPQSPLPPTTLTTGDVSAMALYAGTGVAQVTRSQHAAEIVAELFE